MRKLAMAVAGIMLGLGQLVVVGFAGAGGALAQPLCQPAGTSGMTAAVVASSRQKISGTIDATGCDIGVYVGPGVTNVTIHDASISGAMVHAIFVQDTTNVTIQNNYASGNEPNGELYPESKTIQATGSNHVTIKNNTVIHNGGGGIGVTDDGPVNPGGPNPGMLLPGNDNVITGNVAQDNGEGCGIVVSSYNPGGGVFDNVITNNDVEDNSAGIVVAADMPNTIANHNSVEGNTSEYNGYAGVVIHSNAPGDYVAGNRVSRNTIGGNFSGMGIVVEALSGATLTNTVVINNTIFDQSDPIFQNGDTNTTIFGNQIS